MPSISNTSCRRAQNSVQRSFKYHVRASTHFPSMMRLVNEVLAKLIPNSSQNQEFLTENTDEACFADILHDICNDIVT